MGIKYLALLLGLLNLSFPTNSLAQKAQQCERDTINCAEVVILKNDAIPSYIDERWDSYCSHLFLKRVAPNGMITVFGAEKLTDRNKSEYQLISEFARKWTNRTEASLWPIATGGDGGVMNAATHGAREALNGKGKAISLTMAFDVQGKPEKESIYDLKKETFVYRGLSKREADLINNAQAIVIGLGGLGTEWEMMEALTKIETRKHRPIPVIILAPKTIAKKFTDSFLALINLGLLPKEHCNLLNVANTADKAIQLILMNQNKPEHDVSSACFMLPSEGRRAGNGGY